MPRIGKKGYKYSDYVSLSPVAVEATYDIGTAAYQALPTVFGKKTGTTYYANFVSEETVVRCDQDCYIRINNSASVQIFIPASTYFTIRRRVWRLYYQRVTVDGTLRVWSEGDIPTN